MQKKSKKQLQIQKLQNSDNLDNIQPSYGIVSRQTFLNQLQLDPKVKLPQIQNVVATVNLNIKLDLKHIALSARNTEYNPKRFSAVVIRLREPKTTALIFSTGKMVVTGAKNEIACKLAARKFARIIQKLGFDVQFLNFKVQNIVSSCDVNFPIDLEHIANKYGEFCSYEPEVFPGLVYRMMDPKIVFLIFVSGKIVLTGAKLRQDIDFAFEKIYPVLQDAKKQKKNTVLKIQLISQITHKIIYKKILIIQQNFIINIKFIINF